MVIRGPRRTSDLLLHGTCEINSPLCDCADVPSPPAQVRNVLRLNHRRLVLRGAPLGHPDIKSILSQARAAGCAQIVVRTTGLAFARSGRAHLLPKLGISAVLVPFFSHHAQIHDRLAGVPGAFSQAMEGMFKLRQAGLEVEIEVPVLPGRLQDLVALVHLTHQRIGHISRARLFARRTELPPLLVSSWRESGPRLAGVLSHCRDLGVEVEISIADAIPFCALAGSPELLHSFHFDPRKPTESPAGCQRPAFCADCAMSNSCPGVTEQYLRVHGTDGLQPFSDRPRRLIEQRTTPSRDWTAEQRRNARLARRFVLRLGSDCNQKCPFCSSNETSLNLTRDFGRQVRLVARAGRRGIELLSISGGEPTLSASLKSLIRVARQSGIAKVEVVTNAVLLAEPPRVEELVRAGLTNAFVSLHAHDEAVSRLATGCRGDFVRTVQGIQQFLDARVQVAINHVIFSGNYRYLESFVRFVHERFSGQPWLSFALMTPQHRGSRRKDLLPRISDVRPFLEAALESALALGLRFIVGSRQGIPPCLLGEYRAWSDIFSIANEALVEDQHQKRKPPECATCRYDPFCTGLWEGYVQRYGLEELRPIVGPPFSLAELARYAACYSSGWGVPASMSEVPEALRESTARVSSTANRTDLGATNRRRCRVLLIGSGRRASVLHAGLREAAEYDLVGVVSPRALTSHAEDRFGCPAFTSVQSAREAARPNCVVIAAATSAHFELATWATQNGLPCLVEKPLTGSIEEAEELGRQVEHIGGLVIPAHNLLFAPGLLPILTRAPIRELSVKWSPGVLPREGDAPLAVDALYELVYHCLVIVSKAFGSARAQPVWTGGSWATDSRSLAFSLHVPEAAANIFLDLTGAEELSVSARYKTGAVNQILWSRRGTTISVVEDGAPRAVERRGSDVALMLRSFAATTRDAVPPVTTLADGIAVMRAAAIVMAALRL